MKEARDFYNQFDRCREREIPLCSDSCPFKANISDICERVSKNRLNGAYKLLRDSLIFPGIISKICPAYCEKNCTRSSIDRSVQIKKIEEAIVRNASRKDPNTYNLPSRDESVAVIGAGISGMAFALKMASRKYKVTVFERDSIIGGSLKNLMPYEEYMAEFNLQFKNEKYQLVLNREVLPGDEILQGFAAVYVATGKDGADFDIPPVTVSSEEEISGGCLKQGQTAFFAGGELVGKDVVAAAADGAAIASAADDFIKAGILKYPSPCGKSKFLPENKTFITRPAEDPGPDEVISSEDAVSESSRCLSCRCDGCVNYCDLVNYYSKSPVKMRDEIFLSVKPAGSLVHKSPARKYIAACTQCAIMEECACPEHIELCSMIKAARHQMHKVNKMPAAYKQYYMRDMAFANGEYASLVRKSPLDESNSSCQENYAFFPGCNLGALNPDYVIEPYKWLLNRYPNTGMFLRCCSLPAESAGDVELHRKMLEEIDSQWKSLGNPVLVTACMSCSRHLAENLPHIETISLYELMSCHLEDFKDSESNLPVGDDEADTGFTIFDPCSARSMDSVRDAVRTIASASGIPWEELPQEDLHGCCGFGGRSDLAQPEFTNFVTDSRIAQGEKPYIVYCSNCRDIFNERGKKALHILDMTFHIDPEAKNPAPELSQRNWNRVDLKNRLLGEIWKEELQEEPPEMKYDLIMAVEASSKARKQRILLEDICHVIEESERTGRRTRLPEDNRYKAYAEIGAITLWVEYGVPDPLSRSRVVYNIYSHRMKIKLEAVFNGKKIDG